MARAGGREAGALCRPGKPARRRPRPYSDLARNQKFESTPLQQRVACEPASLPPFSRAACRPRVAAESPPFAQGRSILKRVPAPDVWALIALSPSPNGFTASDVAVRVRALSKQSPCQ
jgi:hypothetical protein